jgi:hypothetical protein
MVYYTKNCVTNPANPGVSVIKDQPNFFTCCDQEGITPVQNNEPVDPNATYEPVIPVNQLEGFGNMGGLVSDDMSNNLVNLVMLALVAFVIYLMVMEKDAK